VKEDILTVVEERRHYIVVDWEVAEHLQGPRPNRGLLVNTVKRCKRNSDSAD